MEESCASRDIAPIDTHETYNGEQMMTDYTSSSPFFSTEMVDMSFSSEAERYNLFRTYVRFKKYGTRKEAVELLGI